MIYRNFRSYFGFSRWTFFFSFYTRGRNVSSESLVERLRHPRVGNANLLRGPCPTMRRTKKYTRFTLYGICNENLFSLKNIYMYITKLSHRESLARASAGKCTTTRSRPRRFTALAKHTCPFTVNAREECFSQFTYTAIYT